MRCTKFVFGFLACWVMTQGTACKGGKKEGEIDRARKGGRGQKIQADGTASESAKPKGLEKFPGEELTEEKLVAVLKQGVGVIPPRRTGPGLWGMYNREAIVPPQCYTRTEGKFNPCYVCHQDKIEGRENEINDGELQAEYSFSDTALTNHWKNLFEDRSQRVSQISDEEILQWINSDNYSELAGRLQKAKFKGYIPDLKNLADGASAFDDRGLARDGSDWVAFNYKPMPSTFWPTNGSTDDVMIRLPELFRQNEEGENSRDVYQANLAILEAAIKGVESVSLPPVDEKLIGSDLNGDGKQTKISRIIRPLNYLGAAKNEEVHTHLYPVGTEFLHTVRYVGVDEEGNISNAKRMKELRYMVKRAFKSKRTLAAHYDEERQDKWEGNLPRYHIQEGRGLDNKMGWYIQSFVEDVEGRLRVATYEESVFCVGCHTTIGSTIDKTFSFARKVDGAKGWAYINLRGMIDAPSMPNDEGSAEDRAQQVRRGEIWTYLARVGGGAEFRNNDEMEKRFYRPDGSLNEEAVAKAKDVYELITPSRERALVLNKAYKAIVEEQDFIYGRDATVVPPKNVYDVVDNEKAPTLPKDRQYRWDIRLDWSEAH